MSEGRAGLSEIVGPNGPYVPDPNWRGVPAECLINTSGFLLDFTEELPATSGEARNGEE